MSVQLHQLYRVKRNYRSAGPTAFYHCNQKVYKNVMDTAKVVEALNAVNPNLRSQYLAASEKYDAVYHQACYGSKLDIAERDVLQAQLILYLDEIALLLEAAALRTPDILLCSGFDLAKERRGSTRTKAATIAAQASAAEQQEQQS